MYQIFVAEDELLIRQSLRNAIESMSGPFAFCGEASDGEIALSMMQDLMPDILLTDIRMPFLDGFGLIQHAKAMMPWLKIIIISGYGDFELAQKAISLGVDQYLLKPVRTQEIIKAIEDTAQQIEKEKTVARGSSYDQDTVQAALRQQFMQHLLYGGMGTAELLEEAQKLNLDIIRSHYLVSVSYFDTPNPDHALIRSVVQQIAGKMQQVLCFFDAADQVTLLAYDRDAEAVNERTYQFLQILRHEMQDICPVITTVIGEPVQRLGGVSGAYKEAARLLKKVSGITAGKVIDVADTAQVAADLVQFSGPLGEDFLQKLQTASVQDVPTLVKDLMDSPTGAQFNSMLMRHYALIEVMRITVGIVAQSTPDADEKAIAAQFSSKYDLFRITGSIDEFRKCLESLLCEALKARGGQNSEQKNNKIIRQAEQYISENFCDPNISLITTARHVGLSSAHFSTVFSQATGRSFIAYLTALRIEQAKKLLVTTSRKLSDIALEIGYNEPNYFSHVFRKQEGMTPKEYRNRMNEQ